MRPANLNLIILLKIRKHLLAKNENINLLDAFYFLDIM